MESRRQKVPLWPPSRQGAYQNLSSTDDLPMHDMSNLSTPGTGMSAAYKSLLTPKFSPSPSNTPGVDSAQNTPYVGSSTDDLKYDSEKPRSTWFGYGWRGGAKIAFFGTVFILLINIGLLVFMTVRYEKMQGFPVIYRGTCENAEMRNTLWHILLNVLSSMLLAASTYCMQLLSAPTRAHIDRAHAKGDWLDIGIASIRNLRFLNGTRSSLWLLLCVSSIPLHLVYNSTFYAAISTNDYNVLYATEAFVKGAAYNKAKFPDSPAQNISDINREAGTWEVLKNHECVEQFGRDFISKYRNVIAVVENVTTAANDNLLQVVINDLPPQGNLNKSYDPFSWICNDTLTTTKTGVQDRNSAGFVPCSAQVRSLEAIANTWWRSGGYSISYCVAEEIQPDCHLHFAPHLMGPVVLMNLVKCIVAFYVAFRMVDVPIVTLGDAIETFLKYPDPTTAGMCLLTAREAEKTFSKAAGMRLQPTPRRYEMVRRRWSQVATTRQWLLLSGTMAVVIAGLAGGFVISIRSLTPATISNALSIPLGAIQTQNLVLDTNLPQLGASAVLITALLANTPQAILSFLYLVYNTLFIVMFMGEDWDLFGAYSSTTRNKRRTSSKKHTHRFLRVSNPKGSQKSTRMLTLPLRLAIPLISMSGLLHLFMSQTLYLANISVIPRDGTIPRHDEITTVAFAPLGMLCVLGATLLMVITVVVVGARRFGGEMQIVGSNSAAISAACHTDHLPERRRRELVLRRIAWGEIPSSDADGGAKSFSKGGDNDNTRGGKTSMYESVSGLGIDEGERLNKTAMYTAEEFSDVRERDGDVEQNGYQALRGQADLTGVDQRGVGRSSGVAHCGFSDGYVLQPEGGKLYA